MVSYQCSFRGHGLDLQVFRGLAQVLDFATKVASIIGFGHDCTVFVLRQETKLLDVKDKASAEANRC